MKKNNRLEDRMVEITAEEQNKEKRLKRIEDNLRDLWDNTKCTNIQIIWVADAIKVINQLSLKSRDYPGFSGWAQWNYKGPLNVEEGSRKLESEI